MINKNWIIGISCTLLAVAIYFLGWFTKPQPKLVSVPTEINHWDSSAVVEQARLNWIPIDSARKIFGTHILGINWKDSIKWTYKDSTIPNYENVPYYKLDTTYIANGSDSLGNTGIATIGVNTMFFPYWSGFKQSVQIKKLKLDIKNQLPVYLPAVEHWYSKFHVTIGPGVGMGSKGFDYGIYANAGYEVF